MTTTPVRRDATADVDADVDVAIIGAGVVGTALARLLSHCALRVMLVERGSDVGAGTSKANTAILHTGFDAKPGSTEARLVARGSELLRAYAPHAGISIEGTGALLIAWNDEQLARLDDIVAQAVANGYTRAERIDRAELYEREPRLGAGALGALAIDGEDVIDPWTISLAFASEAVLNGATLWRDAPVRHVTRSDEGHALDTPLGVIRARWVVNAAGLAGDDVHRMFGHDSFTIRPRRGELIVFDKLARALVNHILLPVPTATTKGVLVSPTVFGNVILGPTADDLDDKAATGSTRRGLDDLLAKGRRIMPALLDEEITAVYAGLRPATEQSDYRIEFHAAERYLCLGGIRSTGLTASMAIAEEALQLLRAGGLDAPARDPGELRTIAMPWLGERDERRWMRGGPMVCFCERVTASEVIDACAGPVPARDLDGVRRRTRAMLGRCQGFACTGAVVASVASALETTAESLLRCPS